MIDALLEERITQLEDRVQEMEMRLPSNDKGEHDSSAPRGWRAFVGVDANNHYFAEAARLGREWRFADSSEDDMTLLTGRVNLGFASLCNENESEKCSCNYSGTKTGMSSVCCKSFRRQWSRGRFCFLQVCV